MAHRTFVDRIGMTWDVWDVRPETKPGYEAFSGVPAGGWLCFQSGSTRKRLIPIPPDWDTLPEDELQRYWRLAAPVALRNSVRADGGNPAIDRATAHARAVPGSSD
jgi:hypothetical protein